MSSMLATIQERARQLSPQRQEQLAEFADFLLSKEQSQQPVQGLVPDRTIDGGKLPEPVSSQEESGETRGLRFDWCDGPDDPPVGLTSVELQHEALEWWVEKAERYLTENQAR